MAPPPSPQFDAAASYLSSSPSLAKVSNATKLEIYALFKYVTVSPRPSASRPSIFDMAGRAKWDAWEKLGKTLPEGEGDGRAEAEAKYLEIARGLGWVEHADSSEVSGKGKGKEKEFASGDPEESGGGGGGGGGSGMGVSVSVMARAEEEEQDDDTIHGIVLSNDTTRLQSFLKAHSSQVVDEKDEYGYTPLHLAADRGYPEMVRILLEKGADRNITDPDGETALSLAEVGGQEEVVLLLAEGRHV